MTHWIDLGSEDVICFEDAEDKFPPYPTLRGKELKQLLISKFFGAYSYWLEGVRCKILMEQGGGWIKGKFRLQMQFIPDDPAPFIAETSPMSRPESPLDDLRAKLNNE